MRERTRRSDRAGAPRRLARWSTFAGAAVAGLLLGFLFSEPLARRVAPGQFTLDTVSVLGADRVAAEELVRTSGVAAGTPVLSLDPDEVSRRLASHPWISEARVIAFLPRKLLVAVVERETAAIAEIGTPASAWLVDESGTPFAPATAIDGEIHPTIVGIPDAQPGIPHPLLAQGVHSARAVGGRGLPPARRVRVGGDDPRALPELRLGPGERSVVLGLAGPTHFEVLEGLAQGEKVVVVGQNLLSDGIRVSVAQ